LNWDFGFSFLKSAAKEQEGNSIGICQKCAA
jgi:hypothetical protein